MIIEIPSTGERVVASIVLDEPATPLAVTFSPAARVLYTLAPMLGTGWRIVEASPEERALLAARGIMVQKR